jgi:hypothetical protein
MTRKDFQVNNGLGTGSGGSRIGKNRAGTSSPYGGTVVPAALGAARETTRVRGYDGDEK